MTFLLDDISSTFRRYIGNVYRQKPSHTEKKTSRKKSLEWSEGRDALPTVIAVGERATPCLLGLAVKAAGKARTRSLRVVDTDN